MKNILEMDRAKCTGCGACIQNCPTKCLNMGLDEYGFLYPKLNGNCISCGKCINTCPALNENEIITKRQDCFIVSAKNKAIEDKSASGGFCAVLAKYCIKEYQAVVFGCCMDDSFNVYNCKVEAVEDLHKIQGSKYVQSNTLDTYKDVYKFLRNGRYVLYMATPCQIAGLKRFLGKNYDNLLTVDIICHGVPSEFVFKEYIQYLQKKYNQKIKKYTLRNKTIFDRLGYMAKITLANGKSYFRTPKEDIFFYLFSQEKSYRLSCYTCKYANLNRMGDFTCGDCASRRSYFDFLPYEAMSTLILNTEKAFSLWKKLKKEYQYLPIDIELEASMNKVLHESTEISSDRDTICKMMLKGDWKNLESIYIRHEKINILNLLKSKIPIKVKQIIYKIMS